jgi:hypothetical protein
MSSGTAPGHAALGQSSVGQSSFGRTPLARAAALIYNLLSIELLLLITVAPCLLLQAMLDHDASNVPLAAACLLPLGPAWSAALYVWQHRHRDLTDLWPARAFWRGYRANVRDALRIWVPWLVWMTAAGTVLTHLGAAGVPTWWAVLLAVITVASALWVANALVIASLFSFRAVDTARLAVYYLFRCGRTTLGNLAVLAATAAVTAVWSEAVPALLASVLAAGVLLNSRPMTTDIRERFTA